MVDVGAIERCAYCRKYVPVTPVVIEPVGSLHAELPICEGCREGQR